MNKLLAALVAVLGVVVTVLLVVVVGLRGDVAEARDRVTDLESKVAALPAEPSTAADDAAQLRADVGALSEQLALVCSEDALSDFRANLDGQQMARGYDEASLNYFSTLYSLVNAVCGVPMLPGG